MRRAEHLHSLEQRVQEYERQGVAATLEMQRAARKVAQENVQLRALLSLHGISSEQIASFLRSSDESSTKSSPQIQRRYVGHEGTRVHSRLVDTAENHSAQRLDAPRPSASKVPTEIPPPETVPETDDTQRPRESYDSNFPCPVVEASDCPTSLDCFCAPPPQRDIPPVSAGLEISCETAAAIIAEMRGDGDRDSIRASLGCRGPAICTIKNSTVLQIMDKE